MKNLMLGLLATFAITTLFPLTSFADVVDSYKDSISINNVYEYDYKTFEKLEEYKNLRIDFIDDDKLSFSLDSNNQVIQEESIPYTLDYDKESNSTLISAKGTLKTGESFSLKLGYDKIENVR
ncbi:hypothetical protein [Gracilibacillus xinjiangensis]|uniref:Uncharacterized protein n=1 Tax=Gracilibacillus xinjiangensis TaxID=1193282 RepID=A0ABV8WQG3_9BACI